MGGDKLDQAIRAQTWSASAMVVEATQRWVETDVYQSMIATNREQLAHRRQWVKQKLEAYGAQVRAASTHVWLPLEEPWRAQDLQASLLAQGVKVLTAEAFVVGRFPVPQAIRFCLGGVRVQAEFELAINKIAEQLAQNASARLTIF